MSKERICPECGHKLAENEKFCGECGADYPVEQAVAESSVPAKPVGEGVKPVNTDVNPLDGQDDIVMGAGSRTNVTGGINKTSTTNANINTSNVDNSNTVNSISNVQNSSTVNNSSSVQNNTTIVMNGKDVEYCEVCGNPFGEKHARCPKCGKQICFDCKVKGKNRCIECEKKSVNEYRVAFQQLLLTTGGNIGIAGRQMMDQKARDLDVEDSKAAIEKELAELYKPQQKPVAPEVAAPVAAAVAATVAEQPQKERKVTQTQGTSSKAVGDKGVGSLVDRDPITPGVASHGASGSSSGKGKFIILALLVVIGIGAFVMFGGGNKDSVGEEKVVKESVKSEPAAVPVKQTVPSAEPKATPVEQKTAPAEAKPVEKQTSVQPVAKKDTNYDNGVAAYDKGDGLKALEYFKKSGSAQSYYMIGVIYETGCGTVGSNAMMARKNFKKAAEMGSAEAKAKL